MTDKQNKSPKENSRSNIISTFSQPSSSHSKNMGLGGHPFARFQTSYTKPKNANVTINRIWRYLKNDKYILVFVTFLLGISIVSTLVSPLIMKNVIDDYIIPKTFDNLINLLLLMGFIYFLGSMSQWYSKYIMIEVSQKNIKKMRNDLFTKIQTLSLSYIDSKTKGDIISRLTNDIDTISNTLTQSLIQLITSGLTLMGVVCFMFFLNWMMALLTLIIIPAIYFFTKWIGGKTRKAFRTKQQLLGNLNGFIEETVTGQKVIITNVMEEATITEFKKTNNNLKKASIKAQVLSSFLMPFMTFVNNINYVAIGLAGGVLTLMGYATVGVIAVFLTYTRQFGQPLNQLASTYNAIQSALAGAERVFEVLDVVPDIQNSINSHNLNKIEGFVTFKNVFFSYAKNTPVLKNISLKVKPGETIALVGPTGAGKTTIVNILFRFYDIDSGNICIDNLDIQNIQKESLRRKLGIVLQDTFLFSGTVIDNIKYGHPLATLSEIKHAAKLANAAHFIQTLPNGYQTMLSEEGNNLSQGQRQLISIARTILKDPSILILDEATSNVDTRTELHIQNAILKLMEGRTSFVIAHRLSTVRNADNILVIDNGEIIEQGNHKDLIIQKGFYYNLYNSQFM